MRLLFLALLITGCSTTQLCLGTCDLKADQAKVERSAQP